MVRTESLDTPEEPWLAYLKSEDDLCPGDAVLLRLGWAEVVWSQESTPLKKRGHFDQCERIYELRYAGYPESVWMGRKAMNGKLWRQNN